MAETAQGAGSATGGGPNPFCEIGRTHPRDRHRMRPVEGEANVWHCPRHDLYARVVDPATAETLDRGDPFPLPGGGAATVLRSGDERAGGVLVYYRVES